MTCCQNTWLKSIRLRSYFVKDILFKANCLTLKFTKVNFRASMPIKSYSEGYREIIVVAHCLLTLFVKRFLMGVFNINYVAGI